MTEAAQKKLGLLLLLACVAIWGVNAVAFREAQRPAGGGPGLDAILLNGVRFLTVAPIMTAFVALRQPAALRLTWRDAGLYLVYGFVAIAFGETMTTAAVRYTSVANMALLGPGTISLCTALWAVALKEQALTRFGWGGAALAVVGVGIVAGSGAHGFRTDAESLKGDGIALSRSLIHGCYLLFLTRTLRQRPVLNVTVYNLIFGALWFLPYLVWKAPAVPWAALPRTVWWALLWTIFPTTLFGYAAWNWTMRRVGAVATTNVMYLLPLTSALAAWTLLGEPIRTGHLVGGAVIVAGILLLRRDAMLSAHGMTNENA